MCDLRALEEGREEGRLFINVYRSLHQLEKIAWEELGAEWGQVQAGKGCQENTLEERLGMRAGTSPWLSPKFNSVVVVKMMVEGGKERKEMRVKEWASKAPGLQPPPSSDPRARGGAGCQKQQEGTHSAIFLGFDSP